MNPKILTSLQSKIWKYRFNKSVEEYTILNNLSVIQKDIINDYTNDQPEDYIKANMEFIEFHNSMLDYYFEKKKKVAKRIAKLWAMPIRVYDKSLQSVTLPENFNI